MIKVILYILWVLVIIYGLMALNMSYDEPKDKTDVQTDKEKMTKHMNDMKIYGGVLTLIGIAGLVLCIYHCKAVMPKESTNTPQFGFRFY